MKVFLSWSGDLSREVAGVFKDWLPSVLQFVEPYVSSEDIDKGARWATDIADELEASSFGLVFLTPENLHAPWIHFESGALSKSVDKARVVPFLLGVRRHQISDPLKQFQSALYTEGDVGKMVSTINRAAEDVGIPDERLGTALDVWWPKLQEKLDSLAHKSANLGAASTAETAPAGPGDRSEILEELLELARSQYRLLTSPQDLLPASYLSMATERGMVDLVSAARKLRRSVSSRLRAIYEALGDEEVELDRADLRKALRSAGELLLDMENLLQGAAPMVD